MSNETSQLYARREIDGELEVVDYAAGRLGGEQRAAFEKRLETEPDLVAQLEEERSLRALLGTVDTNDMPSAGAFEGVAQKLGQEPRRSWYLPAIAAGIVAVFAVAFLAQGPDTSVDGRDDFEVLSSDGAQPVDAGNRFRVVFSEHVDASGRAAAAAMLGFEIVSGPGPGGAYVVETTGPASRDQLLLWREDARIELAEPVRYD